MIELPPGVTPQFRTKVENQHSFLTREDVLELVRVDRLFQVLVRCNNARFVCAVQDVLHLVDIIEEHCSAFGPLDRPKSHNLDWVRDISVPVRSRR